ncbi:MAG TPA: sucrase ferredoxin [Egibacteraceae bacterium]|nr:sucrase ferredoxin [Egibacteraceae bacterium]
MAERFSCALASHNAGEPCYATASQVRRWLLVEQPGPWGADAVSQSRLDAQVGRELRQAARAVGARLLLIRRHGRSEQARRVCYAAVTTAGVRRIERFAVDDPSELLDIDWSPLRRLAPVGGEVIDRPLYLVCTNGSHDACCARFGRPVARLLDEALGGQVWEASHFGGDRFAGNVVCLPDGIYYGRVLPQHALALVEAHQAGQISLSSYRGRSFVPFVAQAAEHFVRQARGITAVDGVLPQQAAEISPGVFRVTVAVLPAESVTATVECSEAVDPMRLTCRSTEEEHPPRYRLRALE